MCECVKVQKCKSVRISKISKNIKNFNKFQSFENSNIFTISKISKSILKSAVLPASLMPLFKYICLDTNLPLAPPRVPPHNNDISAPVHLPPPPPPPPHAGACQSGQPGAGIRADGPAGEAT